MGSFYQNGIVANLHDFSYGTSSAANYKKLENDLMKFSKNNLVAILLSIIHYHFFTFKIKRLRFCTSSRLIFSNLLCM